MRRSTTSRSSHSILLPFQRQRSILTRCFRFYSSSPIPFLLSHCSSTLEPRFHIPRTPSPITSRAFTTSSACQQRYSTPQSNIMTTEDRTYESAVNALNSLQTNAAILDAVRRSGNLLNQRSIAEMRYYLERVGYKSGDLDALNVVHVAGTKGKGSTSAMCESILRRLKSKNETTSLKTGLFTSPHLIEVRERFRINGVPIAKHLFAKYFYDVWDALERTKPPAITFETPDKPAYFRFLTLVGFHAFLQEKVDVAIMEVGMGGEYDSTNVVEHPLVCGVSSLGMDHVPVLGTTLPEIAWHKAGIFKPRVPAFTAPQADEAMEVLRKRAAERTVSSLREISEEDVAQYRKQNLGMKGSYQALNASLAAELCKEWTVQYEKKTGISLIDVDDVVRQGLELAKWPGRAQLYSAPQYDKVTWFLDGAHTKESMEVCADWFKAEVTAGNSGKGPMPQNILLFNCTKGRDGKILLTALSELHKTGTVPFCKIVCCTNDAFSPNSGKANVDQTNHTIHKDADLTIPKQLGLAWNELASTQSEDDHVLIKPDIESAIKAIAELAREHEVRVLVTGSLYLVGGVLTVLEAEVC